MPGGIRLRRGVVGLLIASLLASGCSSYGGRVFFSQPEGGSVRIGNGFAHTIPWSTFLGVGAHDVVLSPNGRSGFLGLSAGEDALRGTIVVLEVWEDGVAEFSVSSRQLEEAAAGEMVRVSGSAPGAYSAFEFKGSLEGVGRSDVEVAGWMANAYARLDPLPADGFAGACIAVVEVIGTILFYVFLFWLESEIDDDGEEECY